MDDTAIWSDNIKQNFYVVNLLETGHKAGLVFNSEKFQFAQEMVDFAGLEVSMDGVRPARKVLESTSKFPRLETISEARTFFGMINKVSYLFSMSPIMEPLRHLLKLESWTGGFCWTPELSKIF